MTTHLPTTCIFRFLKLFSVFVLLAAMGHTTFAQDEDLLRAEKVRGLQLGDRVPDFEVVDLRGDDFRLYSALETSPILIVFYRGQWCPVCMRHLSDLQDSLSIIREKGVELVAISPEKPEKSRMSYGKTGAEFSLLFDEDFRVAEGFKLAFTPWQEDLDLYNKVLAAELSKSHSDGSERLPVPATYLIGQDGTVLWRHFDPDYTQRASVKSILEVLDAH